MQFQKVSNYLSERQGFVGHAEPFGHVLKNENSQIDGDSLQQVCHHPSIIRGNRVNAPTPWKEAEQHSPV